MWQICFLHFGKCCFGLPDYSPQVPSTTLLVIYCLQILILNLYFPISFTVMLPIQRDSNIGPLVYFLLNRFIGGRRMRPSWGSTLKELPVDHRAKETRSCKDSYDVTVRLWTLGSPPGHPLGLEPPTLYCCCKPPLHCLPSFETLPKRTSVCASCPQAAIALQVRQTPGLQPDLHRALTQYLTMAHHSVRFQRSNAFTLSSDTLLLLPPTGAISPAEQSATSVHLFQSTH